MSIALSCAVMGVGLAVCADSGWTCTLGLAFCATLAAAFVIVTTVPDESAAALPTKN